jgi:hypothetical protein
MLLNFNLLLLNLFLQILTSAILSFKLFLSLAKLFLKLIHQGIRLKLKRINLDLSLFVEHLEFFILLDSLNKLSLILECQCFDLLLK